MPITNIELNFPFTINVSVQVGDIAYYVLTVPNVGFDVNDSDVIEIGKITTITTSTTLPLITTLNVDTELPLSSYPNTGDFILFSKDNKANMSSMLGYYAGIRIKNESTCKAELFRISADYSESSK